MPNPRPIRLGLVGAGGVARLHAQAALSLPAEVDVTAVYDVDPGRAEDLAKLTGATVHPDHHSLVMNVDAIAVCTPHALHLAPALAAARVGVHVLMEKPMATTLADCDAMSAACDEAGVVLFLGHIQHYLPMTVAIERAVAAGTVGRPVSILDRRATDYRPCQRPAWFFNPALAGGGAIMNIGAHCIDRVTWIADGRPSRVSATVVRRDTPVEVEGLLHLELDNGVLATVSVTTKALADLDEIEVLGTEATLRASREGGIRLAHPGGVEQLAPPPDVGTDVVVAFRDQLRDFTAAVRHERPPAVDARVGRDVVATVTAAFASAASGRQQPVDTCPRPNTPPAP
ncbi:Gfo/Idh/MocA family oxidoreductase [Dactylosporangium maewongense]|uniref:Gfo/Idh/MocA family oxidoreductase n=1 Tax=Dactylosporangium maewongense TaxID=634393 RepID=A0ABP4P7T8_9ACTN